MKSLFLVPVLAVAVPIVAMAHSGGLDANGGHYNRKTGQYHYHRQSSSGGSSSSASRYVPPSAPAPTPAPAPTATPEPAQQSTPYSYARFTESDWQVAFNNKVTHGKLEVETPTGRIDILTETHAIEVDHARNYRAVVKQALQYGAATKKRPGVALVMDGSLDTFQAVEAGKKLCEQSDVDFWLINEFVSVNDLAGQKPAGAPPPAQSKIQQSQPATQVQTSEQGFWLNVNSGVRHNKSCRWYGNTTNGRPCGRDEGRPCGTCGG
jgi:hypothetical protein